MTPLVSLAVSTSVVLALGLLACAALRRRSAALRHAVLTTAILTALCMPLFTWILPTLPILPGRGTTMDTTSGVQFADDVAAPVEAVTSGNMEDEATFPWAAVAGGLWLASSALTLAGLMTGFIRLARLRRRCTPVTGGPRRILDALARTRGLRRPVTLLRSTGPDVMVTYGVLAPGIIVPANTSGWDDDRWRVVLQHELAHIARADAGLQIASELLRVLYPWNPLVWTACRRLRQESEFACDDQVLSAGIPATAYAAHLLGVAQSASTRLPAWASAPAIAHPSTLERRITAMLTTMHDRSPLTRRGWIAATLAALVVGLPVAAVGPAPQAPAPRPSPTPVLTAPAPQPATVVAPDPARAAVAKPTPAPRAVLPPPALLVVPTPVGQLGAIAGRVVDQTGGAIPGATITLTEPLANIQATAITNATGRFTFSDLAPAAYTLGARLSGFSPVSTVVTLAAGATVDRTLALTVGSVAETITVKCSAEGVSLLRALFPVAAAQTPPARPTPIRIGGQIREPKKVRHVAPVCPAGALASGDISVTLRGRVGVDGFMNDVVLDTADVPPPTVLADAVLTAVRQWQFTPTLLNGQPVDVGITVRVTFTR